MSVRTTRSLFVLTHLFLTATVAIVMGVRSADGQEHLALTSVPDNDPVYALLGEFLGPISVGENKYEPLALQIRPVGGDNFEAVQYRGGLPGQKDHKPEAIKLIGRRSGDFVVLSGGPWAIFVEKGHCLLVDREGKQVGRLERVVRQSRTLGAQPPKDAIVLFDGTNTDQFTVAEMTSDGLLMQGADLKPMFQDFNLHVEFRLPYMPDATGQARGNSGLYLQSRYEMQVLDSFAEEPTFNGIGSLYRFKKPDVNMCLPPLQWQTYDVAFTAPRWGADGSKIRNARITAWLNGTKVQDDVELPNKTGAGKMEEPTLLPIRFQNHKDPVRFRNIWIIDRGLTPVAKFPVEPTNAESKPEKSESTPKRDAKKQRPIGKKKGDNETKEEENSETNEKKPETKKERKPEETKPEIDS